jgi:hypothetical protein
VSLRLAALLLALTSGAAAADAPPTWRPWLEQVTPGRPASAAIPSAAELETLRANRELLARWVGQAPSVAWNDVVQSLVVKYQQNPLRASRVHTYVHVVIHDALVVCAQRKCDPSVRPVAMHAAASRMLEHLYPDESPGRFAALGRSGAAALLANLGGHNQAELAWQAGSDVAGSAIRRALNDGWDMPKLTPKRPAWKPGVWQAAPPMNLYDPAEPHAPQWRTWVLKPAVAHLGAQERRRDRAAAATRVRQPRVLGGSRGGALGRRRPHARAEEDRRGLEPRGRQRDPAGRVEPARPAPCA